MSIASRCDGCALRSVLPPRDNEHSPVDLKLVAASGKARRRDERETAQFPSMFALDDNLGLILAHIPLRGSDRPCVRRRSATNDDER